MSCLCLVLMLPILVESIHCPLTLTKWDQRAQDFNCKHPETYHCLLMHNESLVETCMISESIAENVDGCPWVKFRKKEAFFGHPKLPCNNSDCPTKKHKGYRTDMLYVYPRCFEKRENRTMYSLQSSDETTTQLQHQITPDDDVKSSFGLPIIVAVIIGVGPVLCFALGIFIVHLSKRKGRQPACIKYSEIKGEQEGILSSDALFGDDEAIGERFVETNAMSKLQQILQESRVAMITGMFGSGKTYTALWYGIQCKQRSRTTVVWKIECENEEKILLSLKELCLALEILPSEKVDSTNADNIIRHFALLVVQNLMNRFGDHVFIFDNLRKSTLTTGTKLMKILFQQPCVKCIITTEDRNLFDEENRFQEANIVDTAFFSEDEAVSFFKQGYGTEESLKKLAEDLEHVPIALKLAKAYMKSTGIKANALLSHLEVRCGETGKDIITSSDIDISLFKPLHRIVSIVETEDSSVYQLMKFIQFLEPQEIPVYLFNFLQSPMKATKAERTTNSLVKAIQQFSFGRIHGRQEERHTDKRTMDIKAIISLVIKGMTPEEERRELLLKVLQCCACLLSRDQEHKKDRERGMKVTPHAMKALSLTGRYFKNKESLLEMLSIIMVSQRLRVSLHSLGQIRHSENKSEEMLKICYKLLCVSNEEINNECNTSSSGDDLVNSALKSANRIKVILEEKLQGEAKSSISEFAKDYILYKHRLVYELEMFKNILGKDLEHGIQLSESEVRCLTQKGFAIDLSDESLGKFFLYEAVILAFLSYGLRARRKENSAETKRKMQFHIYLAYHLGKFMNDSFKVYPPYCALESELNGYIELQLSEQEEFRRSLNKEAMQDKLRDVENQLLRISNQQSKKYFLSGICNRENADINHKLNCNMKLLQCCKQIIGISENENTRVSYSSKVQAHAYEIQNNLMEITDRLGVASKSQEAKQILAEHFIERNEFQNATDLLVRVKHFDFEKPEGLLTPQDLHDLNLICICHRRTGNEEGLSRIRAHLKSLKDRINTEYSEAFAIYKNLCSNLGYGGTVGLTELHIDPDLDAEPQSPLQVEGIEGASANIFP